ncbi:MAG: hypothetical protein OXG23_09930 [Chloroflexi bacterium]|nr:hypothetical protein [Chloroflexota bacterium]
MTRLMLLIATIVLVILLLVVPAMAGKATAQAIADGARLAFISLV